MLEIVRTTYLATGLFAVTFSFIVYCCINLHKELHQENDCGMTFMWRILQFQRIPVNPSPEWSGSFDLFLYNEGYAYKDKKTIEEHEIPVLFIPGSGGSAQQVRSIATVLQNKTEMRRAPFRYRFFAVDFGQMWSFSNGEILHNQQNFVVDALQKIRHLTSYKKRIVLIGHSFGGTVAMSLVNHPHFDPNWIELIILKAAPISFSPFVTDFKTRFFFDEIKESWANKKTRDFKHIGVVSYSGGIRDYVVSDPMSEPPHSQIYYRPIWSVDGVPDTGADHLCVLWCNMFVRHVSRVMYHYAENQGKLNGQQALDSYFKQEKQEMQKIAWIEKDGNTMMSKQWPKKLAWRIEKIKTGDRILFDFTLTKGEAYSFNVTGKCVKSVSAFRSNDLLHVSRAKKGRAEILIYRPVENEHIRLLIVASPMCEMNITAMPPSVQRTFRWYESFFVDPHVVLFSFFMVMSRYAIVENHLGHARIAELASTTTLIMIAGFAHSFTTLASGFIGFAIGGSIGVFIHNLITFLLYVLGKCSDIDVLNFHIVDSTVDIIYPWILLQALFIPTIGNGFLILLFALRSSLRCLFFCVPIVFPLFFKTLHNPIPFIQTLDLGSTQHIPLLVSVIAYYSFLSGQVDVRHSFVTSVGFGATLLGFSADQIPLEVIPGVTLVLLTISRFTPNARVGGYSFYYIPPHSKND